MMNNKLPGPAWKIIRQGIVSVKTPFEIREFDEDDGWITRFVWPGYYDYRVLEVNGWKPRQLLIKGVWVDVAGNCEDLEHLLAS